VDAGISCRQIMLRLEQTGHSIEDIEAVFITHEHGDHINGLRVLLNKAPMPVYITKKTYLQSGLDLDESLLRFIKPGSIISIGSTQVQVLPKSHDAAEPCIFNFLYNNKKISIITDMGEICDNAVSSINNSDIIFLESNYDTKMLMEGDYPQFLVARIDGHKGHLSNRQAGTLIREHATSNLKYIFLSHLSENNNTPFIAQRSLQAVLDRRDDLKHVQLIVASRHEASEMVVL